MTNDGVRLYHFSERPDIEAFEPHIARTSSVHDQAYVWAIDDWHAPMYFVPRNCPRACFWPGPDTTHDDRERWFAGSHARMVMTVESGWLSRIRSTRLYRYDMPPQTFELRDDVAGHWVSSSTITPIRVAPLGDLLTALVNADVELRITPRLLDLWQHVIASTLTFSGTRLRYARASPGGTQLSR